MNKHVAGSASTYRGDLLTGSRVNAMLEKADKPDMRTLLIDAGVIRTGSTSTPTKESFTAESIQADAEAALLIPVRPLTLSERLAQKKK
jgi:hypothetical protein